MMLSTPPLSCLFFGMSGIFSRLSLEALLRAGVDVRAVVLPALPGTSLRDADAPLAVLASPRTTLAGSRRPLSLLAPAASSASTFQVAAERNIPVLEVRRLSDARVVETLAGFAPDAICVACFSRRIPPAVLRLPRLGCLNVHPSLLPANRGPDPLFWTFRDAETTSGVTIHLMDEGFDSGPMLAQRALPVAEAMTEEELEVRCATVGGELLSAALRGLAEGSLVPRPQDERLATAHTWPTEDDYALLPDRPARELYVFASGMASRSHPLRILTPDATFQLIEALGYTTDERLEAPYRLDGERLALQCAPGVFAARVARAMR